MKNAKNWMIAGALAVFGIMIAGAPVIAGDCNVPICKEQGGARMHVGSGGSIDLQSGSDFDIESGSTFKIGGNEIQVELDHLDGLTASTGDLNATTNFEETISATTSEVTIATGKTLDVADDGAFQLNNTAVTATAAELNLTDGLTSTTAELDAYVLTVYMAVVCTGGATYVTVPHAGDIILIQSVINGALGTGDVTIDPQIATVDIADADLTLTAAASAGGDVESSTPTAANAVAVGDAIEIATDGGCDGTATATFSILIDR